MELDKSKLAILNQIILENKQILTEISQKISNAKNIAVAGHVNPDGDCIGSQLALKFGLESIGKKVTVINDGPFDSAYSREYADKFYSSDEIMDKKFDLVIAVDVASRERIACDKNLLDSNNMITIDHHNSTVPFTSVSWIDASFISASEMIFVLLSFLNVSFDAKLAQTILNGVLSDNGYYQHIRVHKYESLYLTYLLVAYGGDPNLSYHKMYCNNTLETEKLFGRLLGRLETLCNGKIIYGYINQSDRNVGGQNIDFSSGMIFQQMLSIKGVGIAIFFKVNDEDVNVSFRSTDEFDVSLVAQHFGGGGHKVAAGCTIKTDYNSAKNEVLKEICKLV